MTYGDYLGRVGGSAGSFHFCYHGRKDVFFKICNNVIQQDSHIDYFKTAKFLNRRSVKSRKYWKDFNLSFRINCIFKIDNKSWNSTRISIG